MPSNILLYHIGTTRTESHWWMLMAWWLGTKIENEKDTATDYQVPISKIE